MQGFNMGRYVPPDLEGVVSGNHLHKGMRGKNGACGVQVVRFEMPYAVWCLSCPEPTLVGQGVRFNAEKRHAGSYYSTPIWNFTMRHADCDGIIEIRTDPQNTAYRVISGARKRDTGDGYDEDGNGADRPLREGEFAVLTDEERDRLRRDAFASLEKTIEDREQLVQTSRRIQELERASAKHWEDPDAQNRKLRDAFRVVRKRKERESDEAEEIRTRLGFDVEVLPASEGDAARAAVVDFGSTDDAADGPANKALSKPLFAAKAAGKQQQPKRSGKAPPRKSARLARRHHDFVAEVVGNARAANDPFLQDPRPSDGHRAKRLSGLMRKKEAASAEVEPPAKLPRDRSRKPVGLAVSGSLVDYDSD